MSEILPVLDLRGGQVVRGTGGDRNLYQPWTTPPFDVADPVEFATRVRARFGIQSLYVADLDAIEGQTPQWGILDALNAAGFRLACDLGIRSEADATRAVSRDLDVICALETVANLEELRRIAARDRDRLIFGLDLREGVPIQPLRISDGLLHEAMEIAMAAESAGFRRFLVLDLAAIGAHVGTITGALCGRLRNQFPAVEILTGGGIRGRADVEELTRAGADRILTATALYDGRLEA